MGKNMLQVLVGLFASYRDGDEALQALEAMGLTQGAGHLYQESKRDPAVQLRSEAMQPDLHSEERAECVAHGQYLDVSGAANRFNADADFVAPDAEAAGRPACNDLPTRTLLVIEDIGSLRLATACRVLCDYGAIAVKDPSGHWRFSPHRNSLRSQD